MNPSSLEPQQRSEVESQSSGPNEQRSVRQWTMDGCGSAIDRLPNEVLLKIFQYLWLHDLLAVEQMCLRWKSIVDTWFATTRTLKLGYIGEINMLQTMKRCEPTLKSLELHSECYAKEGSVDWIAEIGKAFPNLVSIYINCIPKIRSESLKVLPIKCCQITRIDLCNCHVTDADLGIVFKGFPGLKRLRLINHKVSIEECFRKLGSDVEHLELYGIEITRDGALNIFSRCKNLQKLEIDHEFHCDAYNFTKFCEKSPLRKLKIGHHMNECFASKELFLPISRLSLLEKLHLSQCPEVDSDVLVRISRGCPNLKDVHLFMLPLVTDRGIKCFAKCKHLTHFFCRFNKTQSVTDKSMFAFAKVVRLESLVICDCLITDRGVAAVLAHCPLLVRLAVINCKGVGDRTVDAAVRAVESRGSSSPTCNLSPLAKWNYTGPSYRSLSKSDYLLWLSLSEKGLKQYKKDFSHPSLHLDIYDDDDD